MQATLALACVGNVKLQKSAGIYPIMNTHLKTQKIRLIAAIFCYLFAASNANSAEMIIKNHSIDQLLQKVFRITTKDGKQTMTIINDYSGTPWNQKWWNEGYDKPCINNVAKLNKIEAATQIKGTNTILAMLECPAANDGGSESIVSLFDSNNTDVPICFSRIDLLGKASWTQVRSIDVRKQSDNTYIIVPNISGGDAGDSWVSYGFIHMDSKCAITLLSKFSASMYHDIEDSEKCEGEDLAYRFINDSVVEFKRNKVICTKSEEKSTLVDKKILDINLLLQQPKLRVIEP